MKICIGTTNKSKLDIVSNVFSRYITHETHQIVAMNTASGVADAPWNEETLQGARNRVRECMLSDDDADFYVGVESGLTEREGKVFEEAWAVIVSRGKNEGVAYSSGMLIPQAVLDMMAVRTMTHDQAMKTIDGMLEDTRVVTHRDTWGVYTGGLVMRVTSFEESLRNALLQIIDIEGSLYTKSGFEQ